MDPVTTDHDAPLAPPGPAVGDELRAAREAQGRSVAEVAAMLKLGPRQLEALEHSDWLALPGPTFVKGFVRNYARLLGLAPEPLLARLEPALIGPAVNLSIPEAVPAPVPYSGNGVANRRIVAGGLLALLLALALFALGPDQILHVRGQVETALNRLARSEAPAPAAPSTAETPVPVAAPAPVDPVLPPGTTPAQVLRPQALMPADTPMPPPAPAAAGSTAVLEFQVDKASWIEVKDRDGKLLLSQKLVAGAVQKVSGEGPLSLVIGYAPGVRLSWRGQTVDLEPHTRADVARLVLE